MPFRWTGSPPARHYARVSFILALLACWLAGTPSWAATVERVDIKGDRIVIRFDQSVADASSFLLAAPRRIAVDVDGAAPGAPIDATGLVSAVRQAPRGSDGTRIVFDLARPAIVTEGSFGRDGRELTLELRTVDDSSFARAAGEGRLRFLPPFNIGSVATARKYEVSMPVPPLSRSLALPRVYGDDPSRPLVVIDAGHGGVDPGAISPNDGRREKDVTLRIAKAIRDELLESGRVRVALTREDDRFLVLQERYGIARKLHADLFISIHCDSVGAGTATGASVYTLSEVASDKESARLAARENKADIISGVNLGIHQRRYLVDPDRPYPARDDEQLGELRQAARPRGAAADPAEAELSPHGLAHGAEGARHAVDPVRDRLYFEPEGRGVHRFARRPQAHRREHPPRGRGAFREATGVERLGLRKRTLNPLLGRGFRCAS